MNPWLIGLIAGTTMLCQDALATILTQAESLSLNLVPAPGIIRALWRILHGSLNWRTYVRAAWRGWVAPWMDQLQWMVGITTTTISVTAFSGHDRTTQIAVFSLVSMANLAGTKLGQSWGQRLLQKRGVLTTDQRIERLEEHLFSPGKQTHP